MSKRSTPRPRKNGNLSYPELERTFPMVKDTNQEIRK
jgi:hypothetical protein